MTKEEALEWLSNNDYVRCKEKDSNILFDSMLWDGDSVIVREATSAPATLYVVSLDVFADRFSAIGD